MAAVLLSIHVVAAIVLIGPITVAASLFPRYARRAAAGDVEAAGVVHAMHRITAGYAIPALAVPVFGLATALRLGVLGDAWLLVSIALTAVAAVLLAVVIVPNQRAFVAHRSPDGLPGLAMATGMFGLLWTVVTILMIVRPGSTTGV